MYELNDDRIPNYAMKSICHGDVKKSKKETNEAMLGYTFPLMQQTPVSFSSSARQWRDCGLRIRQAQPTETASTIGSSMNDPACTDKMEYRNCAVRGGYLFSGSHSGLLPLASAYDVYTEDCPVL
jgi:hypothetical protein